MKAVLCNECQCAAGKDMGGGGGMAGNLKAEQGKPFSSGGGLALLSIEERYGKVL